MYYHIRHPHGWLGFQSFNKVVNYLRKTPLFGSEFSAVKMTEPLPWTISEIFEHYVEQMPDSVAVIHGDEQVSYREINNRANKLAHWLSSLGLGTWVQYCLNVQALNLV
jgi:non-ribosomal peptide synthetase component F